MAVQSAPVQSAPVIPARHRTSPGRWLASVGSRHLVGVVAVLFSAFPIVYVLSASVSSKNTMTDANNLFATFTLDNYAMLACDPAVAEDVNRCAKVSNFYLWFGNSLWIAAVTAVGTVLMGAAAAYAFSRFRFTGRRFGLSALMVIQMFPQMLAFVAILILMTTLGDVVPILGTGSAIGLVAVYLGGALGANTFLMYGFFNTIPKSLDEAAKIDGASHAQTFWLVIIPLVIPILAVTALLSFIGTFGEYILASVVLGGGGQETWTLPMGLYLLVGDSRAPELTLFSAGAVIAALPVLLLFLFLQKYIVSGLTGGAVKG
ncbi:MAG: sugar ABC transporter permease [Propionicimonas sp.]|uniref:sugar ABC transporter permease n=1 Tax=Propionicimonas sp. TaxID=1955623 RepID=UPI002B21735D|nr:sugar ABC transporter permease [Propionicimonas sp.]MEA4943611.1 sugar ABC transporter permease [Propionicimonas sp.]MEA5053368.1 sugar ABC transporter permease [Propionicimonas sp.]MEA5116770.1 sugar ABC transporter permease [Propionicimonas sp.]